MVNEAKPELMNTVSERVFWCMLDFQWWTFWDLQSSIKERWGRFYGEPTISAAIREIRKSHFRNKWGIPTSVLDPIEKKRKGKAYLYRLNVQLIPKGENDVL